MDRGYDAIIAEDAVGGRDILGAKVADIVKVAMAELSNAFGTIVRAEVYA